MSNDPDFEKRLNNQLATIAENQARNDAEIAKILEAVAGMIQVARSHEDRLDGVESLSADNSRQIAELREGLKEQKESVDALIRIVEGHISNHP